MLDLVSRFPGGATATAGAYVSPVRSQACIDTTFCSITLGCTRIPPADIAVTKIRASDLGTIYSAVLGANCASYPGAFAVSGDGGATFAVETGAGFPLQNPSGRTGNIQGGAVAQLSADGSALLFSTFVSASGVAALAASPEDGVYAAIDGASIVAVQSARQFSPRPPDRR